MFNGSNCDRKSQLSEILTEPLNPRELRNVKLFTVSYGKTEKYRKSAIPYMQRN